MANVRLDWDHVDFVAKDVSGWRSFKRAVDLDRHGLLLASRAVYVIRIRRPYSFAYDGGHSPVAYIGKGQAKIRISSHLKGWMRSLSSKIPDLKLRIYFCEPRVARLGTICEHVEADLIDMFHAFYGELPLRNRRKPWVRGTHDYVDKELQVLWPGSGKGYHWAIKPLPSSPLCKG